MFSLRIESQNSLTHTFPEHKRGQMKRPNNVLKIRVEAHIPQTVTLHPLGNIGSNNSKGKAVIARRRDKGNYSVHKTLLSPSYLWNLGQLQLQYPCTASFSHLSLQYQGFTSPAVAPEGRGGVLHFTPGCLRVAVIVF